MSQITFAPRVPAARTATFVGGKNADEFLGGRTRNRVASPDRADAAVQDRPVEPIVSSVEKPKTGETIEKVVRRIPTLYVLAFFGVVVGCAVLIIWNTLQVNKLTLEKTRIEKTIARSEQEIIQLRAEEMQLSAPNRIREIATVKLAMTDLSPEDVVIMHR